MKLLVIADIHEPLWRHGEGRADVLVCCGDVSDQVILTAATAFGCLTILAVKGNHDTNAPFPDPIVDLHLQTYEHEGIRFGGLNGAWKYKPRGHFLYEQAEVEAFLSVFPAVDVFVSHNSPRGIHDHEDEVHFGFEGLRAYIDRCKPKLVLHGHQHIRRETTIDQTQVIGVFGQTIIEL
ncbi:MAG: metallophosphoesterase family protein [Firmicutes bacterium]|nr:metallophosphoesterase family protein [Bacillota bacterium]